MHGTIRERHLAQQLLAFMPKVCSSNRGLVGALGHTGRGGSLSHRNTRSPVPTHPIALPRMQPLDVTAVLLAVQVESLFAAEHLFAFEYSRNSRCLVGTQ